MWQTKSGGILFDSAAGHTYITSQDSNTLPKNVTRKLHVNLIRPHAALSRVLSFVLLSFILYATTVEAAHKHGSLLDANQPAHAATISEPGTKTTSNGSLAGCGECLICQLHQDFSTSLIIERHGSSPPRTRLEISHSSSDLLKTRTIAPRTGRAPPLAN